MHPTVAPYGPPEGEEEVAQAVDILSQSFALSLEDVRKRLALEGCHPRVLREEGRVTASASVIPMGQWFGGRRVEVTGLGAVGVAPERRGLGSGRRLMEAVLRDERQRGARLAVLYASSQAFYRRVGFEQAGSRVEHRVKLSGVDFQDRTLSLRPVREEDLPALREAYGRQARTQCGWLDRGPYAWRRALRPLTETTYGFLIEGPLGVEGYVYLSRRQQPPSYQQELNLTDLVVLTPAAGRRLWTFLGDHRALATEVLWRGGLTDPMLFLLAEQGYESKCLHRWMVRVLDVPAALQARGYPAGVSAALHLDVTDALFPENQGRFVLEVSEGEAEVRRGGDGDVRLDVRALAPLFSGYLVPEALRLAGALTAGDEALRVAALLFSGPPPAMPDMF